MPTSKLFKKLDLLARRDSDCHQNFSPYDELPLVR